MECFQSTFVDVLKGTHGSDPSIDLISMRLEKSCSGEGKDGIGRVATSMDGSCRVFGSVEGDEICLEGWGTCHLDSSGVPSSLA